MEKATENTHPDMSGSITMATNRFSVAEDQFSGLEEIRDSATGSFKWKGNVYRSEFSGNLKAIAEHVFSILVSISELKQFEAESSVKFSIQVEYLE